MVRFCLLLSQISFSFRTTGTSENDDQHRSSQCDSHMLRMFMKKLCGYMGADNIKKAPYQPDASLQPQPPRDNHSCCAPAARPVHRLSYLQQAIRPRRYATDQP